MEMSSAAAATDRRCRNEQVVSILSNFIAGQLMFIFYFREHASRISSASRR
jgi:hypothetical protein